MRQVTSAAIYRELVAEPQRGPLTAARFGVHFLWIESYIYDSAASLSVDYEGGFWDFYTLSNGGFYMAPRVEHPLVVTCANGFEGQLSADAFGATACLYAYSLLSFSGDPQFGEECARQYRLLREYALQHEEAMAIWKSTD